MPATGHLRICERQDIAVIQQQCQPAHQAQQDTRIAGYKPGITLKLMLSNSRSKRCARGFMDSSGMFMNSSAEMYPLWPRSSALKRLYSASISSWENLPSPAGNQSGIRACKAVQDKNLLSNIDVKRSTQGDQRQAFSTGHKNLTEGNEFLHIPLREPKAHGLPHPDRPALLDG